MEILITNGTGQLIDEYRQTINQLLRQFNWHSFICVS